jgi:Putative beta-barrel porin-2, OmpL-like. bbp2
MKKSQIQVRAAMRPLLVAAATAASLSALAPHAALAQLQPGGGADPYKDYKSLDAYLGDDVATRFLRYYKLEWGESGPPPDPDAPPSAREGWPKTPMTSPPMPFTEWPYGAATSIGVTRPNSVDSPLMAAIANTSAGKALNDAHIQIYGWLNAGGNLSTNNVHPQGNAPAAYDFTPNTVQLDQFVTYIERLPDTVQTDHIDWGFRLSTIYGTDYRYTTAFGVNSDQFLRRNHIYGYDFPMEYGELYIPQVGEGLLLRLGRFISVPDIEAQLAPNNYMYSHSLGYTFDNYTNTGLQATQAVTKNFFVQFGVVLGTDTAPWNYGKRLNNPFPNPLYPGSTYLKDPGAQPSFTSCLRYQTDSGDDDIYLCADAINSGNWGYNNLQWIGGTYYHKFNDKWHLSFESYTLSQNHVPNLRNPTAAAAIANGGTPFSPQNGLQFNAPNGAQCGDPSVLSCTARAIAALSYLNYRATDLDNISFRSEFYDDIQGQRTGTRTRYAEFGLGWQHWFSPQVYIRPELTFYKSFDANAFNGNVNAGIAPTRDYAVIGAMDLIVKY